MFGPAAAAGATNGNSAADTARATNTAQARVTGSSKPLHFRTAPLPSSTGSWHLIDGRNDLGFSVRRDLPDARQPVSPHVPFRVQKLQNVNVIAQETYVGRRPGALGFEQGCDCF